MKSCVFLSLQPRCRAIPCQNCPGPLMSILNTHSCYYCIFIVMHSVFFSTVRFVCLFLCVFRKRDRGLLVECWLMRAPQQWVQVETFTSSVSNSSLNCIYQIKRAWHTLRDSAIRGHWCVWQFTKACLPALTQNHACKYDYAHMHTGLRLRSLNWMLWFVLAVLPLKGCFFQRGIAYSWS